MCHPPEVHRYEKYHKRHMACAYYVASLEQLQKTVGRQLNCRPNDVYANMFTIVYGASKRPVPWRPA